MDKKLLTVVEAALVMGVSRALLYQKVMTGEIPSIKIGRARRIPTAAIDEFIARELEENSTDGDTARDSTPRSGAW